MVGKCVGLGIILRLARMAHRLGIVGAKRFDMAIVLDERVRNGRAPDAVGILNLTADHKRIEKTKHGGHRQDPVPSVLGREPGLRVDDAEPAKRKHDRRKQEWNAYELRHGKPVSECEEETPRESHLGPYGIVHADEIVGGYDVSRLRQKAETRRRLIHVIGLQRCARARVERQQQRVALEAYQFYLLRGARKRKRRCARDAALADKAQTRQLISPAR